MSSKKTSLFEQYLPLITGSAVVGGLLYMLTRPNDASQAQTNNITGSLINAHLPDNPRENLTLAQQTELLGLLDLWDKTKAEVVAKGDLRLNDREISMNALEVMAKQTPYSVQDLFTIFRKYDS